ncbi:hypothetical protein BABINDRAFT_68159 [Babjeviella inositovora NRRL Y-12698]|uniref:NADPH:adrenodoxin oxidoreductase, mitochondrial n=1 Tax=Babjeviella inositovora NRRL Y-12698 TaxID=984486 RepID=A0A1E3QH48_9ASCO|nr:uncharacterized protein BABINDRAFT_68159 [Babjeviella inositovora NRRL Y-12698]ODQ77011.1 hypothetical protein BABINDRAFT_68159 [Babjeviella inositovora NRRL Y-12698]
MISAGRVIFAQTTSATTLRPLARRYLSNAATSPYRVAIVGSGPSGFYVSHRLLEKFTKALADSSEEATPTKDLRIDIFEKLPVPYGLSRYGVAPDHPEVKNCQDTFDGVMQSPQVRFFGNVQVASAGGATAGVSIDALRDKYHAVVFSYGCDEDNTLGIDGEDHPGVIPARKFVGWYNGLPEFRSLNPPLDQVENVVIVGNGNVALDVARILLASPEKHWASTDITSDSVKKLIASTVKNVSIVARRGYYESAFTNKEFRELLDLSTASKQTESLVKFNGIDEFLIESMKHLIPQMGRVHKRRLDMYRKYQKDQEAFRAKNGESSLSAAKQWSLKYMLSPFKFISHPTNPILLQSTICHQNVLSVPVSADEPVLVRKTEETETLKSELVITSIGYKGSPLPGFSENNISFDAQRGVIRNVDGRVLAASAKANAGERCIKGLYTSGWIKNGPKGVIATTMLDAFLVGDLILHDLANGRLKTPKDEAFGSENAVSADEWYKIDAEEKKRGEDCGKPREKIVLIDEMMRVAKN